MTVQRIVADLSELPSGEQLLQAQLKTINPGDLSSAPVIAAMKLAAAYIDNIRATVNDAGLMHLAWPSGIPADVRQTLAAQIQEHLTLKLASIAGAHIGTFALASKVVAVTVEEVKRLASRSNRR